MIKFLFFFTLVQAAQAGRYYNSDYGRFVSRDPIGYHDGMSLYNAYFAEEFALDPSGFETYYFNKNGSKDFKSGTFIWQMSSISQKTIQVNFEFKPNEKNCCKNIEFLQVVDLLNMKLERSVPNEPDFQRPVGIDATHMPQTNVRTTTDGPVYTPYYSNQTIENSEGYRPNRNGTTTEGQKRRTGSGVLGQSAFMDDKPTVPPNYIVSFETCAFCVESGEILGCIGWDNANFDHTGTWIRQYGVKWAEPRPSDFFNEGIENWNNYADRASQRGHNVLRVPDFNNMYNRQNGRNRIHTIRSF